jgi:hypothetical protein
MSRDSSTAQLTSAELRRELSGRNLRLAERIPHESTYGAVPSVVYQEIDGEHGNFLTASYRRICASPDWSHRLRKGYTGSKRLPCSTDRTRRELDCANSSDALLMNVFCYPGVTCRKAVCSLLGVEPGLRPRFGVKPGIPLISGRADRTEIDMGLGHLLVEAKLTEGGFQKARAELVLQYQDVEAVFDFDELPVHDGIFHAYQLIRGVLAAHHKQRSFLVICDARRSDLREAWYRVLRAVKDCELRPKMAILTWQELSSVLPPKLQMFLAEKYGI